VGWAARAWARGVVGLAISVGLLVLLLRGVDPAALGAALGAADLRFLPPAVGLYFGAVGIRSWRWRLLLPPGAAPTGVLYRALLVGFTLNNLLPVRLGEVGRAYLLGRWRGVPYGVTAASLVVERVLDGLALAGLLLASLLVVPAPGYVLGIGLLVGGLFAVGGAAVLLGATNHAALTGLVTAASGRLPGRLGVAGKSLGLGFVDGLRLIGGGGLLARLAGLSLLCWLCELSLYYVLMFAFPMPRSYGLAVLAGAGANFATLVPSSPGYVGTFDGALTRLLVDTTGTSQEVALAYAVVVHATLFVPVVVAGALVLWRARVSLGQVGRAVGSAAPRPAGSP
jgi:glycosyltransferase 2 family protein